MKKKYGCLAACEFTCGAWPLCCTRTAPEADFEPVTQEPECSLRFREFSLAPQQLPGRFVSGIPRTALRRTALEPHTTQHVAGHCSTFVREIPGLCFCPQSRFPGGVNEFSGRPARDPPCFSPASEARRQLRPWSACSTVATRHR